ncbi:2-dehydropantoate 2-reductase [Caldisphaera lagunensis DSM 15908]|uniref:2-dehydropantoate 2-reductase n=1 Tax=Caldisphaera lagunensis (strain DSM 15908 / JCM 11604 / ANMR 0165 / IC-154) TaxID=1056495 RepID=L0A7V3_CALLD|nr:2-dehydropantoate 2-reductase [Caldisphaera lagunensis]AFZ69953.1 2-dehydropantoate 2-reductase [Caldisphaera lagunensis DSM 15908]
MKIGVIGCGAIGSFLSYIFKKSGYDVIAIDKIHGCKEQRVIVEKLGEENIRICGYEDIKEELDYLIFTVKAYDLDEAISLSLNNIKAKLAISTQNGLYSLEKLEKFFDAASMIIYYGIKKIEKCHSLFSGGNKIVLGCKNKNCTNEFKDFKLNEINLELVENVEPYRWEKVIINSAINPIATLYLKHNGFILENEHAYDLSLKIAEESKEIASLLNINFKRDPIKELIDTLRNTYYNYNSTLQDICLGKEKTELDYINLALYEVAKKSNYEAKYNYFAYKSVIALKNLIKANNRLCEQIK